TADHALSEDRWIARSGKTNLPVALVPNTRSRPRNYSGRLILFVGILNESCEPRREQALYQVIGLSRLVVDGYRWDHDQRRYGEPHRQFRARGPNGGRSLGCASRD